jgi:hypothetical protein
LASPGNTLVAYVDRATLSVDSVRSFPTPRPVLRPSDEGQVFDPKSIHELNDLLRSIAQAIAPPRTWTGNGWSAMTGELVTVVCREGEPQITSTEAQFHWGWRYSNHLTAAFHGEVYAVTPHGWVELLGESGTVPTLGDPCSFSDEPWTPRVVKDAEAILGGLAPAMLGPLPGECLLCYTHRMLRQFGCDGGLRFASHYRDTTAPKATALAKRLGQVGGFCDCEIFLNGYALRPEYFVSKVTQPNGSVSLSEDAEHWPNPLPNCHGVRRGSTLPCTLWWRRWRC